MKQWTTEHLIVAILLTAMFVAGIFFGAGRESFAIREAEAQVGQTLAERQVIALEKVANELGRMRRDGVKCR